MAGTAEESKKDIFNKVIQWLKDAGLPIVEVEPSDTKLYAKVFPRKEVPMFFI
jgi:aminopeptidase N